MDGRAGIHRPSGGSEEVLDRRPGEVALIDAIRSGAIDKVLLWSMCRIGKSLIELVGFMETCRTNSVSVYLDHAAR